MTKNLWPDFNIEQGPRSPKNVIEEAGDGLAKKTKNIVKFFTSSPTIVANDIQIQFTLYTPRLSYHFPFMRAKFRLDTYYPVSLVADQMPEIIANDEKELIAALTKIFTAPSTIKTIQRLMMLVQ